MYSKEVIRAMKVAQKALDEQGLGNTCSVYILEEEAQMDGIKHLLPEPFFSIVMGNKDIKGYSLSNGISFIFLFRMPRITRKLDTDFIIYHETRHLWQWCTGFEFSSEYVPYELKAEEIDANNYAINKVKYRAIFMAGVVGMYNKIWGGR